MKELYYLFLNSFAFKILLYACVVPFVIWCYLTGKEGIFDEYI